MKKLLCIVGSVLLSLVFAVQMVPWTSFAADGDDNPDPAKTVYINDTTTELDENKTEDPSQGGEVGYYDNGTYTNRDLLEAGDYYVKKQFDWSDKDKGEGYITFKTKLNVTKEPTRAVYAFTPCEAHGFLRPYAKSNVEFLLEHYDIVDLVWITSDLNVKYSDMPAWWGYSNLSGSSQYFDYSNIHYFLDVGKDSDSNGRKDYMDIIYPQAPASGDFDWRTIGTTDGHWAKSASGANGVHQGINLYTGLYAYFTGKETTDDLFKNNEHDVLQESAMVNKPSFIYISFDGLLDTRAMPHSGLPCVRNNSYSWTTGGAANNPLPTNGALWSYPIINYDCWNILWNYDNSGRYFSLGTSGTGEKAFGKSFCFAMPTGTGGTAANNEANRLAALNAIPETFHWELWNELLALGNPKYMVDLNGNGTYDVGDIQQQANKERLWNGHRRITRNQMLASDEEPGFSNWVNKGSGTYRVIKERSNNAKDAYEFDSDYDADFATLNVPTIGITLEDTLSDSFALDADKVDMIDVKAVYEGTELTKTTTAEGFSFAYGEGITPLVVKPTVDEGTGKVEFDFKNYRKDTELEITIRVKVNDQEATEVNKWLKTNSDASLDVILPDEDPVEYDVSSPKAHIEGYHIDTEVIGGTIDPDRDIREGGSCDIEFAPNEGNYKLKSITVQGYKEDGTTPDLDKLYEFDTPEELQAYINDPKYSFGPVYENWKITVVYVELTNITVTKKWLDFSNKWGTRPENLTITLSSDAPSGDEFAIGDPAITKNGTLWTYKWSDLRKYKDDEGTQEITYDFAEDTNAVKGYDYEYDKPNWKVTNTMPAIDVEGTKTWVDLTQKDHNNEAEIELTLTRKTANSEEETVTATPVWEGNNYKFSDLPKKDNNGDEYTYKVTETKVTDGQGNVITYYNTTYDGNNIKNEVIPAAVQFEGTKTLNGRTLGANEFTFELYKSGETDPIESVNNDANGKFSFSQLKYDVTGTYNYTIKEKNNGLGGVTYDTKEYSVTVTVAVKNGKLTATVSGLNETETAGVYGPAAFTNNYEADPCTIQFKGVKTLTGRKTPLQKDEFSFNLKEGSDTLQTKKNGADGSFAFDAITYTAKGEYTYTISEKIPDDAVNNVKNGISYDPTEYTVKVTVDDDGQGHLYIKSVTGLNEDTGSTIYAGVYKGADFLNTYSASAAEVPIAGKKVLENYKPGLPADKYTFNIRGEWAPLPASTGGSGKSEADKKTDAEEPAAEQQPAEEPAVDQQPAQEAPAADEAAEPEAKAVEAEEAAEEPEVKAEEPEAKAEGPEKAEKKAEAAKPEAKKSDSDSEATRADDPTAPPPSNGTSVKNDANGVVDFGKIKFEAEGVYTYYVTEEGDIAGVENDPDSPKKITITVEDNGQGQLVATADPSDTVKFTFTNKYVSKPNSSSVTDSIKIKKELNGHELKADMFTFKMTTDDGKEIATVSNKADGVIEFPPIKFTEEGVYKYWIYEVDEGNKTITYDGTQYQVIATVTEEYTGDPLKVEWTFNGGDSITFKNTYYDQVVIDPPVKKVIKGKAPKKAETYTFKMQADDPSNPMPKAAGGNSSMTVNIKGAGAKEFGEIVFTKPGTYSYTITEVPGKSSNCKYDNSVYKVVAIVTENPDYSLSVERKYYKNGKPVDVAIFEFTNTYSSDNSAGTGDSFKAGILILLMMGSAAAAAVVLRRRKSA